MIIVWHISMKYPFAFTFVFEYYTYYDFSRGNKHPATASIQPGNFLRLAKRTDSRSSRRGGVILYVIGGRVGLVCVWEPATGLPSIHTHTQRERESHGQTDWLSKTDSRGKKTLLSRLRNQQLSQKWSRRDVNLEMLPFILRGRLTIGKKLFKSRWSVTAGDI